MPTHRPCVWGVNPPQCVALVTTRSGQTPPAPKFVLGFPGFQSSSLEQLWVGHVFFLFGTSGLQERLEAEEFAAEGRRTPWARRKRAGEMHRRPDDHS